MVFDTPTLMLSHVTVEVPASWVFRSSCTKCFPKLTALINFWAPGHYLWELVEFGEDRLLPILHGAQVAEVGLLQAVLGASLSPLFRFAPVHDM